MQGRTVDVDEPQALQCHRPDRRFRQVELAVEDAARVGHGPESTRSAACSPSLSEAVRPGLSMPNMLTRPATPWTSGPWLTKSSALPPFSGLGGDRFGRMPA